MIEFKSSAGKTITLTPDNFPSANTAKILNRSGFRLNGDFKVLADFVVQSYQIEAILGVALYLRQEGMSRKLIIETLFKRAEGAEDFEERKQDLGKVRGLSIPLRGSFGGISLDLRPPFEPEQFSSGLSFSQALKLVKQDSGLEVPLAPVFEFKKKKNE